MKYLYTASRLVIVVLGLCLSESVAAGSTAGDITVPFGIRSYDIGAAHNFTLNDIDGERFELDSTRGRWVFLHFWASWCGPCREEMPLIQKLNDAMQGEKFDIVMVNTAEDGDTIFEFLAAINVDLNSLMDADGLVTEAWKPRGLPATFLISPSGKVKYQAIGGREWDKPEYIDFMIKLLSSAE